MNKNETTIEKVNVLIKNSVTLKLALIAFLALLLLIPAEMITTIISERETLNNEAIHEVSAKWALDQKVIGPILTIPLTYENERKGEVLTSTEYWHILPDDLVIDGNIEPRELRRGIYEVVVYDSEITFSGNFLIEGGPDPVKLKEIHFDQSFLTIGVSDLRGIKNEIHLKWDTSLLDVKPGSKLSGLIYSGMTINVPDLEDQAGKRINFDFLLQLQGSKTLSFAPVGNTTEVQLSSTWQSPSFNGNFLPDSRELSSEGFKASWSILQLNRNFPQSWTGTDYSQKIQESTFGVEMILPMDDYQKSFRSAKYAIMTIALTFLVFFLVEILNKRKIHPFQYALVGLSLCLFYILLVSISEQLNFNLAYGISSAGIVAMISLYSLSVFKSRKSTLVLIATLAGIYGFLFITLQLADYALLIGSIGLTLILGLTMYFTRNVSWYNLNIETEH